MKTPATMTVLLFASALGLQAQSYASPSSQPSDDQRRKEQPQSPTSSNSAATPAATSPTSAKNQPASGGALVSPNAQGNQNQPSGDRASSNNSPSNSTASSADPKDRSNQPAEVQENSQQANNNNRQQSSSSGQTNVAQTGSQTKTQADVTVTAQTEAEVRTLVQQIDAQGPVVVERISTEFADATCTQENARALVVALHDGTSVTLRNEDGQTATFTPTVHLGYGDAYIALSVAVQALRDAGITGCASPAQWQAVLLGGELAGPSVRTTSVTTERFPGVLVLHEQGGWTKVAQTTHVQLNQVVSQANSSLQIDHSGSSAQASNAKSTGSTGNQQNLSPTGFPAGHDPRASDKSREDAAKAKNKDKDKDHDQDMEQKKDDMNSPDTENPPKSETPPRT